MHLLHLVKLGSLPKSEFVAFLESFGVLVDLEIVKSSLAFCFLVACSYRDDFSYRLQICYSLRILDFSQSRYNHWHQLTAGSLNLRGGPQTHIDLGTGVPISMGSQNLYDTGISTVQFTSR